MVRSGPRGRPLLWAMDRAVVENSVERGECARKAAPFPAVTAKPETKHIDDAQDRTSADNRLLFVGMLMVIKDNPRGLVSSGETRVSLSPNGKAFAGRRSPLSFLRWRVFGFF